MTYLEYKTVVNKNLKLLKELDIVIHCITSLF